MQYRILSFFEKPGTCKFSFLTNRNLKQESETLLERVTVSQQNEKLKLPNHWASVVSFYPSLNSRQISEGLQNESFNLMTRGIPATLIHAFSRCWFVIRNIRAKWISHILSPRRWTIFSHSALYLALTRWAAWVSYWQRWKVHFGHRHPTHKVVFVLRFPTRRSGHRVRPHRCIRVSVNW